MYKKELHFLKLLFCSLYAVYFSIVSIQFLLSHQARYLIILIVLFIYIIFVVLVNCSCIISWSICKSQPSPLFILLLIY